MSNAKVCLLSNSSLSNDQTYLLNTYIGEGKWEEFYLEDKKRYEYYQYIMDVQMMEVNTLVLTPEVPMYFTKLAFMSGKEVKVFHEITSLWNSWELL